ncbi:MAG: RNA polymerase-binding protein RbpA [Angustibacter sp.]
MGNEGMTADRRGGTTMSDKSLRGTRLGAQSLESDDGVEPAARRVGEYHCPRGHVTRLPFSVEAQMPPTWECSCGAEALLVNSQRPEPVAVKRARTHWDMLLERRSIADLEVLLAERLELLRATQTSHQRRSA